MNFAYVLLLFRGVSSAFTQTNDKHILSKLNLDKFFTAFFRVFISAILLIFPLYLMDEYQHLSNFKFITYTLANVLGNVINILLLYKVTKKYDISYISTIKTTQPFIFAIVSFFILGEILSKNAILGLTLVVLGSIVLEKSRLEKKEKFNLINSGWPLILLQVIISAIITNFSKMAVLEGSPLIYIWLRCSIMSFIFFFLFKRKYPDFKILKKGENIIDKNSAIAASYSGLFLLTSTICEMYAYKTLPIGIVEAITKCDIIILLILEYIFITKKLNKMRVISALLVISGILCLILE